MCRRIEVGRFSACVVIATLWVHLQGCGEPAFTDAGGYGQPHDSGGTSCDKCTPASKRCAGHSLELCEKSASGCFEWGGAGTIINCTGGQICMEDKCSPCAVSWECRDKDVCKAGACVPAHGQTYNLVFVSGEVPKWKEAGPWDSGNGAPDPRVLVERNGTIICKTPVAQDTYTPKWNSSCTIKLKATDKLKLRLVDSDALLDDPIDEVEFDDVVAVLHMGGGEGALHGWSSVILEWTATPF